MKYASEVIQLMETYPGREWRMAELIRYVTGGRPPVGNDRHAARMAVLRVLNTLRDNGQVRVVELARNSYLYAWCSTVQHGVVEKGFNSATESATIRPPQLCL